MPNGYKAKIQWLDINKLIPYINNAKKHPEDQIDKLAGAIAEFGFDQPIVTDKDMVIIKGHGRTMASKKIGLTKVPVLIRDDLNAAQIKASRLADNKMAESEWDFDFVSAELESLKMDNFDISLTGFDDDFLSIDDMDLPDDIDEIPEAPAEPITKLGDLWILGGHRVLCGDSNDDGQTKKLLNGEQWDTCVFDPPYDKAELYGLIPENTDKKLLVFWDFKRFAIAPAAALNKGWESQYEFIWDCIQSWYTPNRPLQRHKAIGYFCDDPYFDTKKSIIIDGKDRGIARVVKNTRGESNYKPLNGAVHIRTVEAFSNCSLTDQHGHGKPAEWIKAIFNGVGGNVYWDPFLGTGTTLMVCEQTNRKCYGMEIDPIYCDVIVKRWETLTGKKAVLADGK